MGIKSFACSTTQTLNGSYILGNGYWRQSKNDHHYCLKTGGNKFITTGSCYQLA